MRQHESLLRGIELVAKDRCTGRNPRRRNPLDGSAGDAADSPDSSADATAKVQADDPSLLAPTDPAGFSGAIVAPRLNFDGDVLHAAGSLATVNVATEAAAGIELGAMKITPMDVSATADTAEVVNEGAAAVFGGTHTATNTIVRPTATGVETFEQLADATAPSDFSWAINLSGTQVLRQLDATTVAVVTRTDSEAAPSDGATTSQPESTDPPPSDAESGSSTSNVSPNNPDPSESHTQGSTDGSEAPDAGSQITSGDAAISAADEQVKNGQVTTVISAPSSTDADGRDVATTLEADALNNTVTLHVEHANSTVAYPVTADPNFIQRTVSYAQSTDGDVSDFDTEKTAGDGKEAPVAPGRNSFRNPGLPGLNIYRGDDACTSGFAYFEPRNRHEFGFMTAGHCFAGQAPTTIWKQGLKDFGAFSRNRDVADTRADAGTWTTQSVANYRSVSNRVFIASGAATIPIVTVQARNSGGKGDIVCVSGSRSGFHCGTLRTGGNGNPYYGTSSFGERQIIRNVYSFRIGGRGAAFRPGDSGAPVFSGDGVAQGIFFARNSRNAQVGYFSQIRNVEDELNVRVLRG